MNKTADGRRQGSRKIIDEKREKYRAKGGFLWNTSIDSKGASFEVWKNHTSAPIRKEKLIPTSKAKREASRNKFVERGGVPDRVESFRKASLGLLNSSETD